MSLPPVPNDGFIYNVKACNGQYYLENTGVKNETAPLKKYMVILAGQSNCQGSSMEPMLEWETIPNPKIKQFSRGMLKTFGNMPISNYHPGVEGLIIDGLDPLQHHGIAHENSVGFGRTFCEEFLKEHPNSEITIMPCALGGTSFKLMDNGGYTVSWDKSLNWVSKNLYNEMIRDCNSVLEKNPDMEVLCMLWHQGESDVGNWQYPNKLQKLVRDVRTDLLNGKGNEIPFLCGTMLASWKAMNSATEYIDNSHKWLKYAFDDGITDCTNFDHISGFTPDGMKVHFTGDGLREMGKGYYQKYKEMMSLNRSRELEIPPEEFYEWKKLCEKEN